MATSVGRFSIDRRRDIEVRFVGPVTQPDYKTELEKRAEALEKAMKNGDSLGAAGLGASRQYDCGA